VIAGLTAFAAAAPASADIDCTYDAPTDELRILYDLPEQVAAVRRSGLNLIVTNDVTGQAIACGGGAATVNNTDTIRADNLPAATAPSLVADMAGGAFAPGSQKDVEPAIAEINFELDWDGGLSFGINGRPAKDRWRFGNGLTEHYGLINPDIDYDVYVGDTESLVPLRGLGGADVIEGAGFGPGPDEITRHFMFVEGGRGADRIGGGKKGDSLDGGGANDKIKGRGGNDVIFAGGGRDKVSGGDGRDDIDADDNKRDRINCGPGNDRADIDDKDKARGCEHKV
jgi:Ca2+-binding RTX toxin-like protein